MQEKSDDRRNCTDYLIMAPASLVCMVDGNGYAFLEPYGMEMPRFFHCP